MTHRGADRMTRHRWPKQGNVISPNKTERECIRCGIVMASIHQWDGGRDVYWEEFYRGLDKIETLPGRRPVCEPVQEEVPA